MSTRKTLLLAALLLCGLALGCARLRPPPWHPVAPDSAAKMAAPLLEQDWLGLDGEYLLRLEGRLFIGSRDFGLSALMRRNGERHTARVVIMGELGVTLCDLDVTPSGHLVHKAAPDLEKAPRILKHVARTVRRVFLLPLPQAPSQAWQREGELMLRNESPEEEAQRIYEASSGLLLGLESPSGGETRWQTRFNEYAQNPELGLPLPGRIEYADLSGGYRVHMLLLSLEPAG